MKINNHDKILIGLTGNIASGKSMALKMFSDKVFEKIDSDKLSKRHLINLKSQDIPLDIPKDTLFRDGRIDIERLSSLAFSDREVMKRLEEVIHPLVIKDIENILISSKKRIAIIESAIIFESNLSQYFHSIITVIAPFKTRVERLMNRGEMRYLEAKKRIQFQMSDFEKAIRSDFIIDNSGDLNWLKKQVTNIERRLISLISS